VKIQASPLVYDTVGHPFQIRDNPQVDGQFNIPYTSPWPCKGKNHPGRFEEDVVRQPCSSDLARKVTVQMDKTFGKHTTEVNIQMKSGRFSPRRLIISRGIPSTPSAGKNFWKNSATAPVCGRPG